MRIAIFRELPLDFQGGVTNVLHYLLLHLKRNGHEAIVFAPDAEGRVRRFLGARVVGVPFVKLPFFENKKMPFSYSNDKYINDIFGRFQPDLVHLLHPMSLSWAAYTSARKYGLPVLASYHTNYHIYLDFYNLGFLKNAVWQYMKWQFNKSDKVLSPSRSVKEMLVQGGMRRVDVWTRGVDSQFFSPTRRTAAVRRELTDGDTKKTVFLFVGRLYKEKNIHFLVDQWNLNGNSRWVITGDGPEREELKKKLKGKNVLFTGYLRGEALARVYASSDVLLFPSTTEGYPNVVMEALASGLPIIGADSFGVRDILDESRAGLLYSPNDSAALNQHTLRMLEDPDYRHQLSQQARRFAESRTWETVMAELFGHYQQLIQRSPAFVEDVILRPRGTHGEAMGREESLRDPSFRSG